jgi:hypothetical protein
MSLLDLRWPDRRSLSLATAYAVWRTSGPIDTLADLKAPAASTQSRVGGTSLDTARCADAATAYRREPRACGIPPRGDPPGTSGWGRPRLPQVPAVNYS